MSKQQFKIEDFGHVNDGLMKRAAQVVADRARRTFSSGGIYRVHNELFKLRETPQTCESCLVTRATKITNWYEWYAKLAAPTQPLAAQMPVVNDGTGDAPDPTAAQATYDLPGGMVMTVHADKSVSIDGSPARADMMYILADNSAIVLDADGFVMSDAKDYVGVVAKYKLVTGDSGASERATLATILEDDTPYMSANELAIVQSRYDQVQKDIAADNASKAMDQAYPVTGGAPDSMPAVPHIILQKIDKDTYAQQGDPFFGIFTPSADDATKGLVVIAETGKAVAAGTYATEDVKQVLSVQSGGKAAYKAV